MSDRSPDPYKLSHRLACLDSPNPTVKRRIRTADDLLDAIVYGCDARGRYYADPALLRRLFWWDWKPEAIVGGWIAELVARNEITVTPNAAPNCYGGVHDILTVNRRSRFPRWARASRPPIPLAVRTAVYERDGYRCVTCWTTDALTLDHIKPYSLGGSDDATNLQTMCRPCNSSKGARV